MAPKRADEFSLEIPLDLSQIAAGADAQELRVVARAQDGSLTSGTVTGEAGDLASVRLSFPRRPGPLQILAGPASATETQLVNLQTISVNVPARTWGEAAAVAIDPIVVAPYFWWWWLEWCRTFVIRGRVTCADGSPVPAATVCAYDLDWWFWWTSTELLGCATTDINGVFRDRVLLVLWLVAVVVVALGGPGRSARTWSRLVSAVLEQDPRVKLGPVRATAQPECVQRTA